MRKWLAIAALAFGSLASSVNAQGTPQAAATDVDPAKLAIARQIVAVVLPPDQRDRMMASIIDSMLKNMVAGVVQGLGLDEQFKSNPRVRAAFGRFVDRQRDLALADIRAAMPGLVESYARAYARNFSLEDLQVVATFTATPAGARFLQRGPALLADPDVADWQRRLAAQGVARQAEEMERFKAELMAIPDVKPGRT